MEEENCDDALELLCCISKDKSINRVDWRGELHTASVFISMVIHGKTSFRVKAIGFR